MSRPPSFLPALRAVLTTVLTTVLVALALPVAGPAAAAGPPPPHGADPEVQPRRHPTVARAARLPRRPPEATPLTVTLASITPSYLPRKGPVEVTGTLTNDSDERWTAINLHAFLGGAAIRTPQDLAAATQTPETTQVGDRIYAIGTFDHVGGLAPGETRSFTIRLKHRYVERTVAGVYWFGVHALGTNAEGHDGTADGRARTFLPLPPRDRSRVNTALVVPLRHAVHHGPAGRVTSVGLWARALSAGGTLAGLAEFGRAAGQRPLTWLVDPAVPDTVDRLVAGNPPRPLMDTMEAGSPTTEPTPGEGQTSSGDPADDSEGDPDGDPGSEPGGTAGGPPPAATGPANVATRPGKAWLEQMSEALSGQEVLALPYGDLDVSAAADRDPSQLERAVTRSDGVIPSLGARTSPAVAAPDGYLDPTIAGLLDGRETVLVGDRMLGGDPSANARVAAVRVDGVRMLPTATSAVEGGPAPGDPLSTLAMRQRLLSEAALRMLVRPKVPLIAVLPAGWSPADPAAFFEGFDVDWLSLTSVARATTRSGESRTADELTYPESVAEQEVPQVNFTAVDRMQRLGATLQDVLTRNDEISRQVADQGLTALSYTARDHADAFRVESDRSSDWLDRRLHAIRITAPRGVTLSSSNGSFATTLVNRLDHPVSVSIRAVTDPGLTIEPPGTLDLAAGGRQTVLLQASAETQGVHRVRLRVTTADGQPLGQGDRLPIRSAEVSDVIWVIVGVGLALLFGAVVVRVVRRVRGESGD